MIWIKKQTINPEVTDYYLEIIGEAYKRLGESVKYFKEWNQCKIGKNDIVVVTRYKELLKVIVENKRYVYWVQGLLPEENYALYHSKFRLEIYNKIERFIFKNTMKKGQMFIFVSDRMKKHYEDKYGMKIRNYYIMPCNNDVIHAESFSNEKYSNDVFCYAGGLNVWQCIDETLSLYKKIEDLKKNTKLVLLVKDKDLAKSLIEKYKIKNYEIDFVPVDRLPERLKSVKYGFIVRKDLELNRVATPTKLMTYMGNGIIPILSECLEGLLENISESEYVVKIENENDIEPILNMMGKKVEKGKILNEYLTIFHNHYDDETHIKNLMRVLPC